MSLYLGIDTSNYTTSLAIYDSQTHKIRQERKLLPVQPGQLGLRQSDAVFAHIKAMPGLAQLMGKAGGTIQAIGVSSRPRAVEGSYMPCFLVGCAVAETIGALYGLAVHSFSHQQGHLAAALLGAGRQELLPRPFLSFHLSGGTSEALLSHGGIPPRLVMAACSLDAKAGQLIDRVGSMLGLPFPAGPALEELAGMCTRTVKVSPSMKGADFHLSGLENQCAKLIEKGEEPAFVAQYCLRFIGETVVRCLDVLHRAYPELPVVFAGGVSANRQLRALLAERFDKTEIVFSPPALSADNAVGAAYLAFCADRGTAME